MMVPVETQWLLVTCGLIAHADGVLDGHEAEHLMAMAEERVSEDDYMDWLGLISDRRALEARYEQLPELPPNQHRAVLEEAWIMAMVDGDRDASELVVFARISERLGVQPMQLQFWREAWTAAEKVFAPLVTELAVYVLGGGESLFEDDHSPFLDMIQRLPASTEEREALAQLATQPTADTDALSRSLAALPRPRRMQAFHMVAKLTHGAVEEQAAKARFEQLGRSAGLLDVARLLTL